MNDGDINIYLRPTGIIDSDHPSIRSTAERTASGAASDIKKAVKLFYFVRDEIRYNPFAPMFSRDVYAASATLERGSGYCVQKAVVLTALCRSTGIPARLCFADIRSHIVPGDLIEMMGTDLFAYHGYAEIYLNGRWVKATPAFDAAMCDKHGFRKVEFDGAEDAVLHAASLDGRPHIEYLRHIGCYDDLPFDDIVARFAEVYGKANPELFDAWKKGDI